MAGCVRFFAGLGRLLGENVNAVSAAAKAAQRVDRSVPIFVGCAAFGIGFCAGGKASVMAYKVEMAQKARMAEEGAPVNVATYLAQKGLPSNYLETLEAAHAGHAGSFPSVVVVQADEAVKASLVRRSQ